jgi:hypothetical protein
MERSGRYMFSATATMSRVPNRGELRSQSGRFGTAFLRVEKLVQVGKALARTGRCLLTRFRENQSSSASSPEVGPKSLWSPSEAWAVLWSVPREKCFAKASGQTQGAPSLRLAPA